jgi:hypothetical protein
MENMIRGSALTPLRESVTALPTPAYWQEGGASSRLAREPTSEQPFVIFLGELVQLFSKGDLVSSRFSEFARSFN